MDNILKLLIEILVYNSIYMINNIYQIINMDTYYCLIKLRSSSSIILYLFHSQYTFKYPLCLVSSSSSIMYKLMSLHDSFMSLSFGHVLYLGQELYKAEMSLKLSQDYIQN